MGGTRAYLSPEVVGWRDGETDDPCFLQQSQDAYAVGLILYQVLTRDSEPPTAVEVSGSLVQYQPAGGVCACVKEGR